jgi:histidinol-phosphatase
MSEALQEFIDFAVRTVEEAGKVILPHFRSSVEVINKASAGLFDPVTLADRAAEDLIRERIRARYPDHGILGEERGSDGEDREYTWVIDPIDGTRAFILGQLHWGTLLGLTRDGQPLLGLMRQPYVGETYVGSSLGARLITAARTTELRARSSSRLANVVVCATDPTMFTTEAMKQRVARVAAKGRGIRYGGDCYTPCLVAAGHADLVIEAQLKPWDIQPLIPIVEAAGGVVTDWSGNPPGATGEAEAGEIIIAANRALHDEVLRAMRED